MKLTFLLVVVLAMSLSSTLIWATDMKGMDSKNMTNMPMDEKPIAKIHQAVGTVKKLDAQKGSVTIAHGAVKTLNWPAMTMTFGVKDKALLDKLALGKKVEVDFVEDGSDYTIVKVK